MFQELQSVIAFLGNCIRVTMTSFHFHKADDPSSKRVKSLIMYTDRFGCVIREKYSSDGTIRMLTQ